MSRVYIKDIGVFLPNVPVDNQAMEQVLGQSGDRPSRVKNIILRSNGITSRYYAIDPQTGRATHTNAELTALAVQELGRAGCPLQSLDLLCCGTTLPDQLMPSHGVMVHGKLGLPPCEVAALSGICVSGMMALKYGYLALRCAEAENVVATGSENVSALLRGHNFCEQGNSVDNDTDRVQELAFAKDFLRWMLSDGAGAVWMADKPNNQGLSLRIDWIMQKSYAGQLEPCMYAGAEKAEDGTLMGWREFLPRDWVSQSVFAIKQDVKLLNENIIEYTVTRPLRELVESGRLDPAQIDWYLPHYSSEFFRNKVYAGMVEAGCDIDQDKWFTNLHYKGNTGSASIYIILEELFHSGRLSGGETLLCYIPESGRFSTAFMQLRVV